MWKMHQKRGGSLQRQLALGLLEDAMSKVDKDRSCREASYSMDTASDEVHVVAVGVPGGPEIVEYVDAEHPYPFGKHYL